MTCSHNEGRSVYRVGDESICMRCGADPDVRWECPYCGVPKALEKFDETSDACKGCERDRS